MKHYIRLAFFISGIIHFFSCQSQNNTAHKEHSFMICSDCNLKDKQGKKTGLWIEDNGLIEVYYKNNIRDGIYKVYNRKNGSLVCFGEFIEGNKSGKWYYFDESSRLILTEENFKENKEYNRIRDDGVEVFPKYTSYVITYYPNGVIKEEGKVLYDEDIEIDFYKKGTWKYYNNEGDIIQIKVEN